jgi:DNA-binding response OmpR family regulator
MPLNLKRNRSTVNIDLKNVRLAPSALLLSDDQELVDLVRRVVRPPWKLVRHEADKFMTREVLAQPNVRLAILDDQAVEEDDRGRLLAQIRKHFSGISLIYVADSQSEAGEKRARANGAHYYVSKPLSLERFGQVLQSFLQAQQPQGTLAHPGTAKSEGNQREATAASAARVDAGIRSLSEELNREDSRLRSRLLDAALAGLRLERNPESPELRRDAAQLWATIEPILSHHLDAEEKDLLPWLERQGGLAPAAGRKVREYHDHLRKLVGVMANVGADRLTDAQAHETGLALKGLAVGLDDAIDDQERRLFPSIRKALFAVEHQS